MIVVFLLETREGSHRRAEPFTGSAAWNEATMGKLAALLMIGEP